MGIEQAAHDPAEDVSAIYQRQCLAGDANVFYHETLISVRRLFDYVSRPAKRDVTVDLVDQVKTPIERAFRNRSVCSSQTLV